MPPSGFNIKWGFKHPIKSVREAIWFSRVEGYPLWQLPYTWWCLTR